MADGDPTDPINGVVWLFFAGIVAIILIVYPFWKRKKDKDEGGLFYYLLSASSPTICLVHVSIRRNNGPAAPERVCMYTAGRAFACYRHLLASMHTSCM